MTPEKWARDFLSFARFPGIPENVRAVVSWEYAESAGGGGMFNPLNTTQGGFPGETDVNAVGVKNYSRYWDGVAANAKVIRNGLYGPVVAAFEKGDSALAVINAIINSPWGTRRIALVPPIGPPPAPPVPEVPKVGAFSFPSTVKGTLKFRGAVVDVDRKTVTPVGGGVLQPPEVPHDARSWLPPYPRVDGKAGFVLITFPDLDEYHYLLP